MNKQLYILLSVIFYPLGIIVYGKKRYFTTAETLLAIVLLTAIFIVSYIQNGIIESLLFANFIAMLYLLGFAYDKEDSSGSKITKIFFVALLRVVVFFAFVVFLGVFVYQINENTGINFVPFKPIRLTFDGLTCTVFLSTYSLFVGMVLSIYLRKASKTLVDM